MSARCEPMFSVFVGTASSVAQQQNKQLPHASQPLQVVAVASKGYRVGMIFFGKFGLKPSVRWRSGFAHPYSRRRYPQPHLHLQDHKVHLPYRSLLA